MSAFEFRSTEDVDSAALEEFIAAFWHSDHLVSLGNLFYPARLPGFLCADDQGLLGFVCYEIVGDTLQLLLIDSRRREQGIGTQLLALCVEKARLENCRQIRLVLTNDNLRALRFFQKRGFSLHQLHLNTMEAARRIKPAIPDKGQDGIPIRHEIELELIC
jgi:ribosomal protein S18 acetylase RimI-like enzyme